MKRRAEVIGFTETSIVLLVPAKVRRSPWVSTCMGCADALATLDDGNQILEIPICQDRDTKERCRQQKPF